MNTLSRIAEKIIEEQEEIIGPIAVEQARKVKGLIVNWDKHEVTIEGDNKEILGQLVRRYQALFGPASLEVCKNAARAFLSQVAKGELPDSLS